MIEFGFRSPHLYPTERWLRFPTSLGVVTPRIPMRVRADTENVRFLLDYFTIQLLIIGDMPVATPAEIYFLSDIQGTWGTLVIRTARVPFSSRWMQDASIDPSAARPQISIVNDNDSRSLEEIRRITRLPYRALQSLLGASHTTLIGLLHDHERTARPALSERIHRLEQLARHLDSKAPGNVLRIQRALFTPLHGSSAAHHFTQGDDELARISADQALQAGQVSTAGSHIQDAARTDIPEP
jgi:hypothetical protein